MISNRITHIAVNDIQVNREVRQRTDLTPESVLDLAISIAKSQWVSPILVDQQNHNIIAGERRWTSVRILRNAMIGDYNVFIDPAAARETLAPICTCKIDSWDNWERIPAQYGRDLTPTDLQKFEFIENFRRQDLPWQDRARAIYRLHALHLSEDSAWSNTKTGAEIGLDHSTVGKNLRVWRLMEDSPSNEIKMIVNEAPTLNSAFQNLSRYTSRREDTVVSLASGRIAIQPPGPQQPTPGKPGPAPGTPPTPQGIDLLDEDVDEELWDNEQEQEPDLGIANFLLNADFLTWAAEYEGLPFNFIHCDFPYGINFNTGEQGKGIAGALKGDYDDSPEVYWNLLQALAVNRDRLIADSCHIMLWHSPAMYRDTLGWIEQFLPDAVIQDFLMIWHCSDLDGIVPDPNRYGRRTYETAFLLTFGDRKIVKPVSLSKASPRESRTRIHRSQKTLPVLNHFFEMFVDDATRLLDPTAGSGTSLLTAHQLGAKAIQGLELNPDTHKLAVEFLSRHSDVIRL